MGVARVPRDGVRYARESGGVGLVAGRGARRTVGSQADGEDAKRCVRNTDVPFCPCCRVNLTRLTRPRKWRARMRADPSEPGGGREVARDHGVRLGFRQLGVLLHRQWLVKRRSALATTLEIFIPVLLMSLLVLGSDLSVNRTYRSQMFADKGIIDVNSKTWKDFKDLVELESRELCAAAGRNLTGLVANSTNSSASTDPLDDDVPIPTAMFGLISRLSTADADAAVIARDTQDFLVERLGYVETLTLEAAILALAESPSDPDASLAILREVQEQVRAGNAMGLPPFWRSVVLATNMTDWNSTTGSFTSFVTPRAVSVLLNAGAPLPVPSFDEYVAFSYAATWLLERSPEFRDLYRQSTMLGLDALGNMLYLSRRKVAFAPDTPVVRELVDHLNKSHAFFGQHFGGIYATEDAAVRELNVGRRENLWGIVAVRDDGDDGEGRGCETGAGPHCVTYAIRMRFTIVPDTFLPYDWFSRTSVTYLRYYTSGFLTLQHAIDNALLRVAGGVAPGDVTTYFNASDPGYESRYGAGRGDSRALFDAPFVPWAVPFPRLEIRISEFYDALGPLLGLLMCMSMMYPLGLLIKGLVEEKENKTQELMSIMGLQTWTLATAHAATYAVLFTLTSLIAAGTLHRKVFPTTDAGVLIAFLLSFMASAVPLGFLIATFFSRAKLASIVGPFALFAMVMPRYVFFQTYENQALEAKRAVSVLSPTAFTFAADLLASREGAERGVTWATLYDDPLSLGELMSIMVGDAVLYAAMAWYLGKVLPTAHGTPLPWWFVFSAKYWRGPGAGAGLEFGEGSRVRSGGIAAGCLSAEFERGTPVLEESGEVRGEDGMEALARAAEAKAANDGVALEPVALDGVARMSSRTSSVRPAVVIQGLRKTFNPKGSCAAFWNGGGGPVEAVSPLSVALYEGQVTGLLGPNGAGKSTTIAMLTGLTPPSGGDAIVAGHSLLGSLAECRRCLGVCPQQNVLFPALTCAEHLRMFAVLKGVPSRDVDREVTKKLREVGLEQKADARSVTLSGGMKRRLQMAMALIGPSKVVLLDEPTSGLDPRSRRDAWRLIRAAAKGRCVVLTTHFLEEADLLCDRVCVISNGKLRCAGSPPFLKNTLGGSYALTLTFDDDRESRDRLTTSEHAGVALRLVRRYVGDATLSRARGGEATMELPASAAAAFPSLFAALERARRSVPEPTREDPEPGAGDGELPSSTPTDDPREERVRLRGYGVSMTTLEEIFLRLAEDDRRREEEKEEEEEEGRDEDRRVTSRSNGTLATTIGCMPARRDRRYRSIGEGNVAAPPSEVELADVDPAIVDLERGKDEKGADESDADDLVIDVSSRRWLKRKDDLREMLRKRWIIARRDRRGFFFQIILPILVNIMVMCVLFLEVNPAGPNRDMTPCMFTERTGGHVVPDRTRVPVAVGVNSSATAEALAAALSSERGWISGPPTSGVHPVEEGPPPRGWKGEDPGHEASSCILGEALPASVKDSHDISLWLLNTQGEAPKIDGAPRYIAVVAGDPKTPTLNYTHCVAAAGHDTAWRFAENATYELARVANVPDGDARFYATGAASLVRVLERYGNEPLLFLHNTSSHHAIPAAMAATHSAVMRNITGVADAHVTAGSHPLPLTTEEAASLRVWMNTLAAFFLLLPFSYLAATYAAFVVKERATRAMLQQLASGCDYRVYWLGAAIWEWLNHALVCFVTWIWFFIFDLSSVVGTRDKAFCTLVLLLAYGAAAVPLSFIYSLGFTDHAQTIVALSVVNFVTGFVLVNLNYVMRTSENEGTARTGEGLAHVWRIFPPFLLGEGLIGISTSEFAIDRGERNEDESWLDTFSSTGEKPSPFDWEISGRPVFLLLTQSFGYFALLCFLHGSGSWARQKGIGPGAALARRAASRRQRDGVGDDDDDDVAAEAAAVRAGLHPGEYDVVIDGLVKAYRTRDRGGGGGETRDATASSSSSNTDDEGGSTLLRDGSRLPASGSSSQPLYSSCVPGGGAKTRVAVDRLSLRIRRGERFGLLGVNGAGKSTTLKVLCGDHPPTAGSVTVCGHDVSANLRRVQRVLGYCPQFDPLLELMTGRETTRMYAALKGVPPRDVDAAAAAVLRGVGLAKFADAPCGTYSGGNKRKLSLAVALVGGPRVLLLDEPSSGMCPLGRRMMWDTVERAAEGLTVLLTTHAMDECEALCERVGMMAGGRLRCLGSSQHLKGRFGEGYVVDAKVASAADGSGEEGARKAAAVRAALEAAGGGGARIAEAHAGRLKIRLADAEVLAGAFDALERCRAEGVLENYAVTQSSLEDVFVRVCK